MRIISGSKRGAKLLAPDTALPLRPTSDRARESMFNLILHHKAVAKDILTGAAVVDLCCGTGALGLEALSRGAASCVFIDHNVACLKLAQQNAAKLGFAVQANFVLADIAALPINQQPAQLLFADPPYGKNLLAALLPQLLAKNYVTSGALLVLETGKAESLPLPAGLELLETRVYGAAKVWLVMVW